MKKTILLTAVFGLSLSSPALTLDEAIALARKNSPRLKAAQLNTEAAGAAVGAAGLRENPRLEFEAEGVGGDRDIAGDADYTVGLSQTFLRGGKRAAERSVAERSVGVARQEESEAELGLLSEVRRAFVQVFYQQEVGTVRAEQEQLGRAFVDVAGKRLESGGGSELDMAQAELALDEILLSQTCCFGDLEAARIRLAFLLGIPETELDELSGSYYELEPIDPQVLADSHPALQRISAQIDRALAQAAYAAAQDSADIKLEAGVKYEAAGEANTFVVGASIPLNFVRGGRAKELAELARSEALRAEREELRRDYQQQLSMLIAVYRGAKIEAEMTRDQLMPKAGKAYQLSREGYEAGRFSWVELINTQQKLAEIKVSQIEALKDAHLARAEITRFMNEEF
jgi:cobalt-zinc-cadmium efflux system outer membrane protein